MTTEGRVTPEKIGQGIPIPTPDGLLGLNVTPGDKEGLAKAVALIHEKTGTKPVTENATPKKTAASEVNTSADDDDTDAQSKQDASTVSKRSLKLDELDELIMSFDGEELVLSKEELAKGAGLYRKNNERAEELAKEKKALEAERVAYAAKASNELSGMTDELASVDTRLSQLDEWLEFAYRNNHNALRLKDGSVVEVSKLEKEAKGLELSKRKLERRAEEKKQEILEASAKFRAEQETILAKLDAELPKRRDELAAYLEKIGFNSEEANSLVHAKAELVYLLDKARKFDMALNAKPEKKVGQQTKTISRPSTRDGVSSGGAENEVSALRQKVQSAKVGTHDYMNALKELRIAELKNR